MHEPPTKEIRRPATAPLTWLTALLLLTIPLESVAQQSAPDEPTTDQTDADDQNTESPPPRPGVEQFDDITVKRMRPEGLPPEMKTELPNVLRGSAGRLPTPPTVEKLQKTASHVRNRVYELISIHEPQAPGDSTPIIRRGHAVLVSGKKENTPPILISSYFWLSKAEKLFLVPHSVSNDTKDGKDDNTNTPRLKRRSLEEVSVDGRANGWLEKHRSKLVPAGMFRPDEHRNLVTIVPRNLDERDGATVDLPNDGLELFDTERKSPMRLYGYSPQAGDGLSQTKLLKTKPKKAALVYYLQTTYAVVFGAPIVSTDGHLLVLTAFKHPKQRDIVLTIPPAPIADYVESILATLE